MILKPLNALKDYDDVKNLAASIAKFGQSKRNGDSPRVAVIEGNRNHLSVGSVLHLENQQYNLHEAFFCLETAEILMHQSVIVMDYTMAPFHILEKNEAKEYTWFLI